MAVEGDVRLDLPDLIASRRLGRHDCSFQVGNSALGIDIEREGFPCEILHSDGGHEGPGTTEA